MDMGWLRTHILGLLKGEDEEIVAAEARIFVAEVLPSMENHEACEIVKLQSFLILVSATISPLAESIADHFKAKAYFATLMETKDGVFTGRISLDVQGRKLETLNTSTYALHFSEGTFMTDNKEDLPLLKKMKKVIVVVSSKYHEKFWINQGLSDLSFFKFNRDE